MTNAVDKDSTTRESSSVNKNNENSEFLDKKIKALNDYIKKVNDFRFSSNKPTVEQISEFADKNVPDILEHCPENLRFLYSAGMIPGDRGQPCTELPSWFDIDKFHRGQKFALENYVAVSYGELLGLVLIYCADMGLRPMIFSGNSSSLYTGFKRYTSTASRIRNWYLSDPFEKGTQAYKDMLLVRSMHQAMIAKFENITDQEMIERSDIKNPYCPLLEAVKKDVHGSIPPAPFGINSYIDIMYTENKPKGFSQADMVGVQFAFAGMPLLFGKKIGAYYATEEELDDFIFMWRCFAYFLGIEDKYNVCRGTLAEVRERMRCLIEMWAKPNFRNISPSWEHMSRCMLDGFGLNMFGISFTTVLLHLFDLLEIDVPTVYKSISYTEWLHYKAVTFALVYGARVPIIKKGLNLMVTMELQRGRNLKPEGHKKLKDQAAKIEAKWANASS